MKKISLFLATTAIIIGMMSCDKLKAPYIIEPIVEDSDTIPLTPDDINNFDGRLVVLLEDYTGVKCNNCPAAAEIANQLQEQNEGHLPAVSRISEPTTVMSGTLNSIFQHILAVW